MEQSDDIKATLKLVENRFQLTRRDFFKASALFASGLLVGSAGSFTLSGCDNKSEWESTSFPKVLLHNFQLFDGVHNGLQKDLVLLIKEDKIQGIERRGELSQYRDFKTVDMKGWTILLGFIDNHVHMTIPFIYGGSYDVLDQVDEQIAYNFRNCVMSGVTTVRDVGAFPGKMIKFREKADKNEIPGPRLISSLSFIAARKDEQLGWPEHAPYFEDSMIKRSLGGNIAERPTTVDEIREVCEQMIKMGAQWLKTLHQSHTLCQYPRKLPNHDDEGYKTILKTGKRHDIKCALHAPFVNGFKKGVDLGFHTLEHMPIDNVIPDRYIERFTHKGMAILPTVMIYGDAFIEKEILKLVETRGKEFLTPEVIYQVTAILRDWISREKRKLSK